MCVDTTRTCEWLPIIWIRVQWPAFHQWQISSLHKKTLSQSWRKISLWLKKKKKKKERRRRKRDEETEGERRSEKKKREKGGRASSRMKYVNELETQVKGWNIYWPSSTHPPKRNQNNSTNNFQVWRTDARVDGRVCVSLSACVCACLCVHLKSTSGFEEQCCEDWANPVLMLPHNSAESTNLWPNTSAFRGKCGNNNNTTTV